MISLEDESQVQLCNYSVPTHHTLREVTGGGIGAGKAKIICFLVVA